MSLATGTGLASRASSSVDDGGADALASTADLAEPGRGAGAASANLNSGTVSVGWGNCLEAKYPSFSLLQHSSMCGILGNSMSARAITLSGIFCARCCTDRVLATLFMSSCIDRCMCVSALGWKILGYRSCRHVHGIMLAGSCQRSTRSGIVRGVALPARSGLSCCSVSYDERLFVMLARSLSSDFMRSAIVIFGLLAEDTGADADVSGDGWLCARSRRRSS